MTSVSSLRIGVIEPQIRQQPIRPADARSMALLFIGTAGVSPAYEEAGETPAVP
jgi:hypothetical protein